MHQEEVWRIWEAGFEVKLWLRAALKFLWDSISDIVHMHPSPILSAPCCLTQVSIPPLLNMNKTKQHTASKGSDHYGKMQTVNLFQHFYLSSLFSTLCTHQSIHRKIWSAHIHPQSLYTKEQGSFFLSHTSRCLAQKLPESLLREPITIPI